MLLSRKIETLSHRKVDEYEHTGKLLVGMAVGEGGTRVAVSSNSVDSLTRTNFTSPWFT